MGCFIFRRQMGNLLAGKSRHLGELRFMQRITITRKQWEEIGRKAQWMDRRFQPPEVCFRAAGDVTVSVDAADIEFHDRFQEVVANPQLDENAKVKELKTIALDIANEKISDLSKDGIHVTVNFSLASIDFVRIDWVGMLNPEV